MTDRSLELDDTALVDNPTARVPVALCLDTSGSMDGDPIAELNEGIHHLHASIYGDELARYAAEIAVVTFGSGGVQTHRDFAQATPAPDYHLDAGGLTPMGEAVNRALDLLDARKEAYKATGVDYYQPWLVLMTDGHPTDDVGEAAGRVSALAQARRLTVFPIGIGEDADLDTLARFSPKRPPLRLRGLAFDRFFEWLSRSVQQVSASLPGEEVPLDVDGLRGWGTL